MPEVIIIGGGPAGSAMGSYLSMAGIDNLIIETLNHPRPHVGESMVTSTTRVFKEIGVLPILEQEGHPHKYGAAWHAPNGKEFDIEFREFPQEGIDQEYTYHVDRGKFDLMLLKRAEELGSKVVQGVHVRQVLFNEDGYASGVRASIGGQTVDIPARIVVDASGRGTLLGRQIKIKVKDPIFNQYAVHAWFEGLNRSQIATGDFIHIYFLPIERGWVWQIPITDTITSVGVVVDQTVMKAQHKDLETFFWEATKINPDLEKAMASARRINDFKTEGDYSYSMESFVGNGWLLVGDAARFVDPIFSSGVSVAMHSAKFGAEQIVKALQANDLSREFLQPYEVKLRKGVSIWYEFIRLYYKLLPLFTHFIQSPKHRLDVLRLLQGEVFDRDGAPVLEAMRQYIAKVEAAESHLFKGQLTDIPID